MTRQELDNIEKDLESLLGIMMLVTACTGMILWEFMREYKYQREIYQQYE